MRSSFCISEEPESEHVWYLVDCMQSHNAKFFTSGDCICYTKRLLEICA